MFGLSNWGRHLSLKIARLLWRWWRYKMGQDRLWSLSLESQGLTDRRYPRDLHATWTDISRDIMSFFSISDKSLSRVCLSHHASWEIIIKMHICKCHLMHRLIVYIANDSFEIRCMKICCFWGRIAVCGVKRRKKKDGWGGRGKIMQCVTMLSAALILLLPLWPVSSLAALPKTLDSSTCLGDSHVARFHGL